MAASAPSTDLDFGALLASVIEAFKANAGDQNAMIAAAMKILSGDWSPFDTARPKIKEFLSAKLPVSESEFPNVAQKMADTARDGLSKEESIIEIIGQFFKDDADPLSVVHEAITSGVPAFASLTMRHDDTSGLFSSVLKAKVVDVVGQALEKLSLQMIDRNALPQLFQTISAKCSPVLMRNNPDQMQMIMLGFPMALNQLVMFHGLWKSQQ